MEWDAFGGLEFPRRCGNGGLTGGRWGVGWVYSDYPDIRVLDSWARREPLRGLSIFVFRGWGYGSRCRFFDYGGLYGAARRLLPVLCIRG